MKVVLFEDVKNVGKKYDVKDVAGGFARNALIPQGKAQPATSKLIKRIEDLKRQEEESQKLKAKLLENALGGLDGARIEIKSKAAETGSLYADIHPEEIAEAIQKQHHVEIPASSITLSKKIDTTGEHEFTVEADKGKSARVLLSVLPS